MTTDYLTRCDAPFSLLDLAAQIRRFSNFLFTTWFFGVARDWRLFAWWPDRKLLWMGCLTDTD